MATTKPLSNPSTQLIASWTDSENRGGCAVQAMKKQWPTLYFLRLRPRPVQSFIAVDSRR